MWDISSIPWNIRCEAQIGVLVSTTGTQSIDRAAALLTLVVRADEPISFTDLVEDSGLARSTTSRLLAAMERHQLLERDQHGYFVAGPMFALYAARHDPWAEVARLARPTLERIGDKVGETVTLAIPRGDQVVQIAQVDSSFLLGTRDWVGVEVPAHCSATGKVLLAFGGLGAPRTEGPTKRLPQPTDHSVALLSDLDNQLAAVRRKGYAVTREELEVGLDAVAAPVLGRDGSVVAAVGVSGPTARMSEQLDHVGQLLVGEADQISGLLRRRTPKEGVA
ncbi:MAG: IclR family transcriptional regulator [Nocardioidaceae bacterium]|nr:IclR family transcriptional regulator [Nocardioidaceae bacterium]